MFALGKFTSFGAHFLLQIFEYQNPFKVTKFIITSPTNSPQYQFNLQKIFKFKHEASEKHEGKTQAQFQ